MNPLSFFVFVGFLASSSAVSYVPGVLLGDGVNVTDWAEFAQNGIQFAINRGTVGASYVDPTFATNWEHLEKLNITHGVYHDYDSSNTPQENFANVDKHILSLLNWTNQHLFRVTMVNNAGNRNPQSLSEDYHTFLWLVENKYKFKPIIYTEKSFWDSAIGSAGNDFDFGSYRLWIYDDATHWFQPAISSTWKDFYMWTFTASSHIKGSDFNNVQLIWMKQ